MQYYIGIDGGGTKTEAVMADEDCNIIRHITVGPSNPNDIGTEKAADILVGLLKQACTGIVTERDRVFICAGIAGAGNQGKELEKAIKLELPIFDIEIVTDAMLTIYSALADNDGACIICGTGSICYVQYKGQIYRIGGWGYLIDSGGNGYSIGRDVIESALRYYDGREGSKLLYDLINKEIGTQPEKLISDIYSGGKPYIASFAHFAFEAAAMGDRYAVSIVDSCISVIYEYLERAYEIIGEKFNAWLSGGIAVSYSEIAERLSERAEGRWTVSVSRSKPVIGALIRAYSGHFPKKTRPDFFDKLYGFTEYNFIQ